MSDKKNPQIHNMIIIMEYLTISEYDLSSIQWIKIILKNTSGIYLLDSSLNRSFNFCSRSFYVVFPLQSFYIEEIIIPRVSF